MTCREQTALRQARAIRVAAARQCPATFAELVLRDERTGAPLVLAPMHEQWHDLIDEQKRMVLWSHVESGKSQGITVGRTLWELGRDPSLRAAIVSNTANQARKFLGSVARYIKTSAELREVFPDLVPDEPWRTDSITVRRPTVSKDPSVQAIGVHGNILGARLDLVICDDILDYENCRTQEQRQITWEWFHSTLLGRLTENARVVVLGVAFHPDDLMHRLAGNPGWFSRRFSIETPDGPSWPERWSAERIADKRQELGPLEAARQLDCLARSDEDARFKREWLDHALDRGRELKLVNFLLSTPPESFFVTGVDLAVSTKRTADLSAIATLLVHANGDRELVGLESGRWNAGEIIRRILKNHTCFQPRSVVVESNAAQEYIAQMVRQLSSVPVVSYTTGRGKMSLQWQVEALATEFSNGKWILPSRLGNVEPEVSAIVRDMLYYSPQEHTPDRLAALCFARWGAQRGARRVTWFNLDTGTR